jgi:hypothetical protein
LPKLLDGESITLRAPDNEVKRLSDIYRKNPGTVLIFWQINCPCVKRYEKRVNKIFERYGQHGIEVIYVSSNSRDSYLAALKEYKKRKSLPELMRDEGGHLAKLLDARGTPTAALINEKGELVYLGWIDNERDEQESMRIAYLENAILDVMNKMPVKVPMSPMFGCPIN